MPWIAYVAIFQFAVLPAVLTALSYHYADDYDHNLSRLLNRVDWLFLIDYLLPTSIFFSMCIVYAVWNMYLGSNSKWVNLRLAIYIHLLQTSPSCPSRQLSAPESSSQRVPVLSVHDLLPLFLAASLRPPRDFALCRFPLLLLPTLLFDLVVFLRCLSLQVSTVSSWKNSKFSSLECDSYKSEKQMDLRNLWRERGTFHEHC